MEQGENGATGSAAGRQMAEGGGISTRCKYVGPIMDGEDEDEQIKQSLSKPSSSILSHHNPDPGPANLTVGRAGTLRASLTLLLPKGEVRKRRFAIPICHCGAKGVQAPKGLVPHWLLLLRTPRICSSFDPAVHHPSLSSRSMQRAWSCSGCMVPLVPTPRVRDKPQPFSVLPAASQG